MQVIGSGFTKISAERFPSYKKHTGTSTNIEFTSMDKEDVPLLEKQEAIKISYKLIVGYEDREEEEKKSNKKVENQAEVIFEGSLILSAEKDEAKEIIKSWKKKELPNSFKIPLFNVIMRKCTSKAISLEEELGLPTHIPLPQVSAAQNPQTQAK